MSDSQRKDIKEKVEVAEARNQSKALTLSERVGEKTIEGKDRFLRFAKDHPVALIGGGIVLGVAISALFPRSPTRRLGGKAAGLAVSAADLAMAYAVKARAAAKDAALDSGDLLEDMSDSLGDTASHLRRDAHYYADTALGSARSFSRDARKNLGRTLRKFR
ncbi:hypothetical protein D6851_14565 [Altericroceibacterium spongiae]|uniref:Uncharacterized protein n=1 Tax=Altericroceibacterium spongiae TaxID=2320269 RepID=A0A420ECE8_9SPHN|nr:hypothetical protein [Altericroceibacterium spongiae]RKF18360.1 hypothetical protein D6851_14565 [Altericroceibacterium spongiae]